MTSVEVKYFRTYKIPLDVCILANELQKKVPLVSNNNNCLETQGPCLQAYHKKNLRFPSSQGLPLNSVQGQPAANGT